MNRYSYINSYSDQNHPKHKTRSYRAGRRTLPAVGRRRAVRLLGCTAAMSVVFFLIFGGLLVHAGSISQTGSPSSYKYYTSIMVHSGDTLYSIAERNMGEQYPSAGSYVREVMRMNSLSDEIIHPGRYLIIPYYSSERKL